mmetsp:Transcript_1053/g.2243  ORF Transcript_1053/g.2243 Transcript_1053/m.2243 type:complete len:539 (-) Transcript_1053:37-1653(-)
MIPILLALALLPTLTVDGFASPHMRSPWSSSSGGPTAHGSSFVRGSPKSNAKTTTYLSLAPSVAESAVDLSEYAPRNIIGFKYWASTMGIEKNDCFKLEEQDKKQREIYAMTTRSTEAGTAVLYVPEHLILSSSKAMAELRTDGMAEAEEYLASVGAESQLREYYLMLKVLLEYQKGSDSEWHKWLDALPRYYSNAVAMTEFCLTCLPPLMKKLAVEERDAQKLLSYDSIQSVPFLADDIKEGFPRDMVTWAYQIVYTRSVETEDGDLKIIPMGDFFDHASDYAEIVPQYDEAGNYYAVTAYDVPAGKKLRYIYSNPRNPSHLLARYGFIDEICPATYCKLLPPTVNEEMIELGYSQEKMLFYRSGEVADEVWDIFLYTHLSSVSLEDQQLLMQAHRTGDAATKLALHDKYYHATSAALLDHVDGFIEDIDRLIKKAQTIGVDDVDSIYIRNEHPRLPLIHKHNLFLRETFQNVRDRYASAAMGGEGVNWKEATKVLVEECDETECSIAECIQVAEDEWSCEGGLGDRPKSQQVILAE